MGNITIKDALRKSMQVTKQYIDKTDDFIFTELIESQNHLKAKNGQFSTDLLDLNNPLYQKELGSPDKAGNFYFNIEQDISDYYVGVNMHTLFLDSNDKAVLFRTAKPSHDVNMQIMISNGVLPSGKTFTALVKIVKNKIYNENITLVESVGKSCVSITLPIQSNTEEIINELKTLKLKVILSKYNFLPLNNNNEFTPTDDYNPATKKYVDDTISNLNAPSINDIQFNTGELDAYLNGIFTENRSVEEIATCMYYVEDVEGAPYNFVMNEDGFYESTNQGIDSSYSMCKVTIVNTVGAEVIFDCINSSQSAYDFGILSNVGQELAMNASTDGNYKYLFMYESSLEVKSISYGDVSGVIYVKYRKDSSGFGGNDSLQFKVRFNKPL